MHRLRLWKFAEKDVRMHPFFGVVQVDECCLHTRRFQEGRLKRAEKHEMWVFGVADASRPGPVHFALAPCRDTEYCIDFVSSYCAPGTLVVTDEWGGYNALEEAGFGHETVCHKREFVNPESGWHTQRIEGMWSVLKRWLKGHDYKLTELTAEYIGEHSARYNLHRCAADIWQVLFVC
jgi:hypothetical protein